VPEPSGSSRFDLGAAGGRGGVRYGFTDAVGVGERAFYIAAAEDSPNAIDDGLVLGAQLGVIEKGPDGVRRVRATSLVMDGRPFKAEGIAFDPENPSKAWLAIDPDDTEKPSTLVEIELVGPW
jgi:hypothetical protein